MPIPHPGDTLSLALDWLKAHPTHFLFPIARLEKSPPLFTDNLNLASNDPQVITQWYKTGVVRVGDRRTKINAAGCNWGISLAKSHLVAVDVDTKPGKVGKQTLDALIKKNGDLPRTLIVETVTGGRHFYFNEANGVVHSFAGGVNGFGADIDSPNYTVMPGCWLCTSQTKYYEVVQNAPIADTPEWFKMYLKGPAEKVSQEPVIDLNQPENEKKAIKYLEESAPDSFAGKGGERTLLLVAGYLKDIGISQDRAVELIRDHYNNSDHCMPLWDFGDDAAPENSGPAKIANAYSYLREAAPGAATAEYMLAEEQVGWDLTKDELSFSKQARAALLAPDVYAYDKAQKKWVLASEYTPPEDEPDGTPPTKPKYEEGTLEDALGPDPDFDGDTLAAQSPPPKAAATLPLWNTALPSLVLLRDTKPRGGGTKELGIKYVWITALERFVKRLDPTVMLKMTQFDSEFNYIAELNGIKGSISKHLFRDSTTLRRYHHMAFRPGGLETNEQNREYNSWRDCGIEPKEGDTSLWNTHLNYMFPDHQQRQIVLNWCAWILQNPSKKPKHGIMLIGTETGTGKSLIVRAMEQIVGEKNTKRPKNTSMGGEFNSWLANCRLCIIEELHQTGQWERMNALRDIVTEPTVEVNIKGIPAYQIPNYVCFMAISNHTDAAPLYSNDRRWQVVRTWARPRSISYYQDLIDMLPEDSNTPAKNPEALRAIAWELMHRDLTMFHPDKEDDTKPGEVMHEMDPSTGKPVLDAIGDPVVRVYSGHDRPEPTAAREEMVSLSRSDVESWLFEAREDAPFSWGLLTIEDILEAISSHSSTMQKQARTSTRLIPTFLENEAKGRKIRRIRLHGGLKRTLWHVMGKQFRVGDRINISLDELTDVQLADLYEQQKSGTKITKPESGINSMPDEAF